MTVPLDDLPAILARVPWRVHARADGFAAQARTFTSTAEVRREWAAIVRSIDSTSHAGALPRDLAGWLAYQVRVADVTLWLSPVVSADHVGAYDRERVRVALAAARRASMSRLST